AAFRSSVSSTTWIVAICGVYSTLNSTINRYLPSPQLDQVRNFEDALGAAHPGRPDHRASQLLRRDHGVREKRFPHREKRGRDGVRRPRPRRAGPDAVQRLDVPGPDHVRGLERKPKQCVLSLPLDARPHDATLLGAVGARARDIEKPHAGISLGEY